MQALDSVFIKADVELGGTDQTFNLMMGRQIQKVEGQSEQAIVTFPLLVGLDGVKKMSKSLNNHIGLSFSPEEKFGKLMSISDETMFNYMRILLGKNDNEINELMNSGINPMHLKLNMAEYIVAIFHGNSIALECRENFTSRFSKKNIEETAIDMELDIEEEIQLNLLIKKLGFASSNGEANRKIEQGGVKVNGQKITDPKILIKKENILLQVGKLNAVKLKFK